MARAAYPHMFFTWKEMNHALQDVMRYASTLDEALHTGTVATLGTVYERIARVMDFITERSVEMDTYEDESDHKHPIPFTNHEFGVLTTALIHYAADAPARTGWSGSLTTEFYAKVDAAREAVATTSTYEEA